MSYTASKCKYWMHPSTHALCGPVCWALAGAFSLSWALQGKTQSQAMCLLWCLLLDIYLYTLFLYATLLSCWYVCMDIAISPPSLLKNVDAKVPRTVHWHSLESLLDTRTRIIQHWCREQALCTMVAHTHTTKFGMWKIPHPKSKESTKTDLSSK